MTADQYNECVKLFANALYRYILKNLNDIEEAKNIVQSTFEKAWVKRDHIDYQKAKPYLFKIAYHEIIDFYRHNKRLVSDHHLEHNNTDLDTNYTGIKETINFWVNKLPEVQKNLILLRDYEGYDYQSIADITGLSEGQVKINLFRARTFLKNKIGKIESLI